MANGVDGPPGFSGDAPAADPDGGSTDSPSNDGGGDNDDDDGGGSDGVDGPPGFAGDAAAADPRGGATDYPGGDGYYGDAAAGSADPGGGRVDVGAGVVDAVRDRVSGVAGGVQDVVSDIGLDDVSATPDTATTGSVDMPSVGVGSGPTTDEFDTLNESTFRDQAEGYRTGVAEPVGDAARTASPASELDRALPGSPVGRTVEGVTAGAASIGNIPAAAAGAISAGERIARDTRRANEPGGRAQNRRELASDAVDAATATGTAIQRDPVGTLSRLGGAAVGGAVAGGAASRALRGTPSAPDTPDGTIPSGRSDVGTGGRGSLLEELDIDTERGVTGPSTASRVRGEVGRTVDEVRDRFDDFVGSADTDRGQLQIGSQGRGTGETDFGDAPDFTRPPDAGGTFDDVREDVLTQTQEDLRGLSRRPNAGDYEGGPSPFRAGGGDTIDVDGGVQLQRTTGTPDADTGTALGRLDAVNDATGIAPGAAFGAGSQIDLDSANDPSGIVDGDVGAAQADQSDNDSGPAPPLGDVAGTNDPSGVDPSGVGEREIDSTTRPTWSVGTADPFAETDVRGSTVSIESRPTSDARTGTVGASASPEQDQDTAVPVTTQDLEAASSLSDLSTPAVAETSTARLGRFPSDPEAARTPRLRDDESEEESEAPMQFLGLDVDSDTLDSGIASAEDMAAGFGSDPFRL